MLYDKRRGGSKNFHSWMIEERGKEKGESMILVSIFIGNGRGDARSGEKDFLFVFF